MTIAGVIGMWTGEGSDWRDWRSWGSTDCQAIEIARDLLSGIAILTRWWRHRTRVADGPGGIARERDEGGVEGAGDVFEDHLHRGDIRRVALRGPGEDVAADTAGGSVKNPCAGVARSCETSNVSLHDLFIDTECLLRSGGRAKA